MVVKLASSSSAHQHNQQWQGVNEANSAGLQKLFHLYFYRITQISLET